MKIFFTLVFLLWALSAEAALRNPEPECPYTGHSTCSDGVDNDHDGERDEAAPSAAFQSTGSNYRANIDDCQKLTFANTTDVTFPPGNRVDKVTGTSHVEGEIACAGTFTNATYEVFWLGAIASTGPSRPMWLRSGSTHGLNLDNVGAATFVSDLTVQWQQLFKTGSLDNFVLEANSATALSFALNGAGAIYIKSHADIRHGCIFLRVVGDTTSPSCADETPSGSTADYVVLKLSGSAPTSCSDSQFNNANVLAWTGFSDVTDATPTVKILHDSTKFYMCATFPDNTNVAPQTANDSSMSGNDRVQIVYRNSTATSAKDANTFHIQINFNPSGGVYDANFPSDTATTSDSRSVSRTVDANVFASWTAGFTLTDGMQIVADLRHADFDATLTTRKAHNAEATQSESNFLTPANWGLWDISATQVSGGGGDVTAPVVSSFAVPSGNIEQTSAIGTANTDEAGTCRIHYGTSSGNYTSQSAGSASTNGVCSEAITGLTAGTQYFAEMRVTDAAGNTGDSTEVTFTTDAASTITHHVGPTATGTGSCLSSPNRCLPATAFALASVVPGSVINFENGTYTGANGMIAPPSGKNGTQLAPITAQCGNPGNCTIDAANVTGRRPINLVNNSWWIIKHFEVKRGQQNVGIHNGSSNNKLIGIISYDADVSVGTGIILSGGSNNNLFEYVAHFGTGRKGWSAISNSNNNVCRDCFMAYGGYNGTGGPDMSASLVYNNEGNTFENLIGTWTANGADANLGVLTTGDNKFCPGASNGSTPCATSLRDIKARVRGAILYVPTANPYAPSQVLLAAKRDDMNFRDIMVWLGSGHSTKLTASMGNCWTGDTTGVNCPSDEMVGLFARNFSLVGGSGSSFSSHWQQTNIKTGTLSAIYGSDSLWSNDGTSKGARFCDRWVDGVLTSEGVFNSTWEAVMVTRLNAAILAAGETIVSITGHASGLKAFLEATFGTIPAACLS